MNFHCSSHRAGGLGGQICFMPAIFNAQCFPSSRLHSPGGNYIINNNYLCHNYTTFHAAFHGVKLPMRMTVMSFALEQGASIRPKCSRGKVSCLHYVKYVRKVGDHSFNCVTSLT